jgi:hypothetical protein
LAETDGRTLHAKIIEITNALQMSGLEKQNKKWKNELEALDTNLNVTRAKLEKQLLDQASESKGARREKRYLVRLEAFSQWLDVVRFYENLTEYTLLG